MKKLETFYRWEAVDPDGGFVVKRGPVRTDISKVVKYVVELEDIVAGRTTDRILASYWNNLTFRIVTRTVTPWIPYTVTQADLRRSMHSQASEVKV